MIPSPMGEWLRKPQWLQMRRRAKVLKFAGTRICRGVLLDHQQRLNHTSRMNLTGKSGTGEMQTPGEVAR